MKKVVWWLLPIVTLVVGFYLGSMSKKAEVEKMNVKSVEESNSVAKEERLFNFVTPAGYEVTIGDNTASVWKEGRPKPNGDTDVQSDLSVWVNKTDIGGSQFASTNPKLIRPLVVSGYNAKYYKITDELAGNPYLVVVNLNDGRWIYIESAEQKLLDEVLITFNVKNSK